MPALIDIRRRIRSVKNTQQITKAMKMVSAAKLRRAQEAMFAARPYARKMLEVLGDLAARAESDAHPLLQDRGDKRVVLIVITSDKGLCGGFNANIIRTAVRFLAEREGKQLSLALLGRKGRDFFKRRQYAVRAEQVGIFQALRFSHARQLAHGIIESFVNGEFDQVFLVYNEFKSVIQQRVVVDRLLPIERGEIRPDEPELDYIYEPSVRGIFTGLLPKFIETQVWHALLESAAAEHSARMTAMDAATTNASDVIESLTLHMNKVRQAAITREIIEIVSGASA
ncbi:MAG: ATP synthase F1 subunit gamma [Solirubrobacterales bacterium]|jgi:F-type H+-transporting ATPase subunit gamma